MTISNIVCVDCGFKTVHHSDFTTGYGIDANNRHVCFECCGKRDAQTMREKGKYMLYYSSGKITNWPGTLSFTPYFSRESQHNIGGKRIDFWFMFEGRVWHGYQIGRWNEIAHVRQTKAVA